MHLQQPRGSRGITYRETHPGFLPTRWSSNREYHFPAFCCSKVTVWTVRIWWDGFDLINGTAPQNRDLVFNIFTATPDNDCGWKPKTSGWLQVVEEDDHGGEVYPPLDMHGNVGGWKIGFELQNVPGPCYTLCMVSVLVLCNHFSIISSKGSFGRQDIHPSRRVHLDILYTPQGNRYALCTKFGGCKVILSEIREQRSGLAKIFWKTNFIVLIRLCRPSFICTSYPTLYRVTFQSSKISSASSPFSGTFLVPVHLFHS